jgi:hypothetical protein
MNGTGLRKGLLAAERVTPALEERYRERLRALTERRLTPVQRGSHVVGLLIALGLVGRFIQLFVQHRAGGGAEAIVGLTLGLAFSAGWALAEGAVLASGVNRFFSHGVARTQLIVVFTFLLAGVMLWAGIERPNAAEGIRLILFGLVFWCAIGLPFLMAHLVTQGGLRVRADVLRLELMLAERNPAPEVRP